MSATFFNVYRNSNLENYIFDVIIIISGDFGGHLFSLAFCSKII